MTIPQKLDQMTGGITALALAVLLGCSVGMVYKQAKSGAYPSYHIGASLYFDPAVIARILERAATI
jgi:hypothetical protein